MDLNHKVEKCFAVFSPDASKEWHPVKNGDKTPEDVSYGSHYKAWWICSKCGYEWQATVKSRSNGGGCPVCCNRTVWPGHNDMATINPKLASEWHPTKNGDLKASDVTPGSSRKVWWQCPECEHEWMATIASRSSGIGCPLCGIKKIGIKRSIPKEGNSLFDNSPILASEWHPVKNGDLKPKDINCKSHRKVWWICPKCSYEWEATPHSRSSGNGCPACSNRTVWPGHNDLATLNPKLASEWHPTKNGDLKASDVTPKSGKIVWWLGKCGHEWRAGVYSRANGNGCKICSSADRTSFGEKAVYYYLCETLGKDNVVPNYRPPGWGGLELDIFVEQYKIAIEYDGPFHSRLSQIERDNKKNKMCKDSGIQLIRIRYPNLPELSDCISYNLPDISDQSIESSIRAVLETVCLNNHHLIIPSINLADDRIKILEEKEMAMRSNSVGVMRPELLAEWNYDKNGNLSPDNIQFGSKYKVWWKCSKCGYEWISTVGDRSNGHGCPLCSNKAVLTGQNDLATNNPFLASEWNLIKNGDLKPWNVTPYSGHKVWWKCSKCGYEWATTISSRSAGGGCPACSNRVVRSGHNDLVTKNPPFLKEWHPTKNDKISPKKVTPGSNQKVWWKCSKCGYEWQTAVKERSRGRNCPACSGKAVWPGHNDLATVNPILSKEWHPTLNGEMTPDSITQGSRYEAWWLCSKCGHEWKAPVYNRSNGSGCPVCNTSGNNKNKSK